jgi:hypothetical protein
VIASSVEQLKDRQYLLEQQIAQQKRLIGQQQDMVRTSSPPPDESRSGSYGALLKRKTELEGQIQDYASKFTDKYPKLVTAREQLAEVNRQIAQAGVTGEQNRAAATSPAAQELRNLERELGRMQTELEVVERELNRKSRAAASLPGGVDVATPAVAVQPAGAGGGSNANPQLDYAAQALHERYTALLRREDALRQFIPSTAGPTANFFQTVDAPSLPQAPTAPHRSRLMIIAMIMGLITGLVAAVIAEIPRLARLYDERDVNYFIGVPMLAAIPDTPTETERRLAQRRVAVRVMTFLIIGAAAVPLLAFILNASRLFHIIGYKH